MVRLEIHQQMGRIGMHTTSPAIQLQTTPPQLEMHSEAATVDISQGSGKLEIDATACREAIGIKSRETLIRDFAQDGMQTAMEEIAHLHQIGDRLMDIAHGKDEIVNMAEESIQFPTQELTYAFVPLPDIRYIPTATTYNPHPGKVAMQYKQGTLDLQLQRGRVDIHMEQYPRVDIRVTGMY